MSISIDSIAADIQKWADDTFPDRTDASMFLKLYGEIYELVEAGNDTNKVADEIADLMILLLDYARRKGVHGITHAILTKMRINRQRVWDTTSIGVMQHAKE